MQHPRNQKTQLQLPLLRISLLPTVAEEKQAEQKEANSEKPKDEAATELNDEGEDIKTDEPPDKTIDDKEDEEHNAEWNDSKSKVPANKSPTDNGTDFNTNAMDDDDPSMVVKNPKNEKPVAADEQVETETTKPKTVEEDTPTTKAPTPSVAAPKNTEAVKMFRERARTEETAVKQQNAGNTALTTLQMSQKMSRRMSKKTTKTFQTKISAGRTKNQLAAPAGKEPKTDVNSTPKRTKSKAEKKKAKPPEASKLANSQPERPNDVPTSIHLSRN